MLPVSGQLEIDVAGLQAQLSRTCGAFIHDGMMHTQEGASKNKSIIVDISQNGISQNALNALHAHPFIELTSHTQKLVDYISHRADDTEDNESTVALWVPLLIDGLTNEQPSITSRLSALKAIVEIDPFRPWSVERMADHIDISASRLHAMFRDAYDETPHAWLCAIRMRKVCALLRTSALPIAEIACRAGFSDQTALTRAMRNDLGLTPAAYRKAMTSPQ